ncbi:MAG: Helix-turn-helix domain [Bacteroidota bacterium]|jgi:ribosome-binding protein aMBF1 (putative translation factor)
MKAEETEFGTLVLKALEQKNMSRQELADELNSTHSSVCNWISGKMVPNLITALRICKMLDIDANQIIK